MFNENANKLGEISHKLSLAYTSWPWAKDHVSNRDLSTELAVKRRELGEHGCFQKILVIIRFGSEFNMTSNGGTSEVSEIGLKRIIRIIHVNVGVHLFSACSKVCNKAENTDLSNKQTNKQMALYLDDPRQ